MKRITLMAVISMMFLFLCAGCGGSAGTGEDTSEPADVTETQEPAQQTDAKAVKKQITDIDETEEPFVPLGLDSVQLLEDGTLILETDGELEKAAGEEITITSDATDVFVLPFGNGGFRSVIFLREDGSVSALNTSSLINDHNIDVMDQLGGYTDVKTLESAQDEDAFGINAVMNSGDKFPLDPYLK